MILLGQLWILKICFDEAFNFFYLYTACPVKNYLKFNHTNMYQNVTNLAFYILCISNDALSSWAKSWLFECKLKILKWCDYITFSTILVTQLFDIYRNFMTICNDSFVWTQGSLFRDTLYIISLQSFVFRTLFIEIDFLNNFDSISLLVSSNVLVIRVWMGRFEWHYTAI